MKILFYDTKKYDKESFDKVLPKYEDIEIEYVDSDISVRNAVYAKGFEAVCGFVSSDFSAKVIIMWILVELRTEEFLFSEFRDIHLRQ